MADHKPIIMKWITLCALIIPFWGNAQSKTCPPDTYRRTIVRKGNDTFDLKVETDTKAYFFFLDGEGDILNVDSSQNTVNVSKYGVYRCRFMSAEGCKATVIFNLNSDIK